MERHYDKGVGGIITDFDEADISWPGGRKLYRWWREERGERLFPTRQSFSPVIMSKFLPSMALHYVGDKAGEYIMKLLGSEIVQNIGFDPTGKPLESLGNVDTIKARHDWVLENKKPYLCNDIPMTWVHKEYKTYSALTLPLGATDDAVDVLIANLHFHSLSDGA